MINLIFVIFRIAGVAGLLIGTILILIGLIRGIFTKQWKLLLKGLIIFAIGLVVTMIAGFGWGINNMATYEDQTPLQKTQQRLNIEPIEQNI